MGWGGSAESEQYQLFSCQLVLPLCLLLDCVGLMHVRFNINMATIFMRPEGRAYSRRFV